MPPADPHAPGVSVAVLAAILLVAAPASAGDPASLRPFVRAEPPRPVPCADVAPGGLQDALASAEHGASLCLLPGVHPGPVRLDRAITIWGRPEAVIRSSGEGTTVALAGAGCSLLGLTVDGSGGRFDQLDAAVHVIADDARVEGVRIENAVFGILVEKASRAIVRGCDVAGSGRGPLGLRGDGIRLWETRASIVADNRMSGSRDLVIWYSPGNRLTGNLVEDSRYGAHLMYSHDSVVEDNIHLRNVVGIFVMYSRNVRLDRNVLALGTGAAGIGLGIKESGNVVARQNVIARNTVGLYVDSSPSRFDEHNAYESNAIEGCDVAVKFHASERRNRFDGNTFRNNQVQVRVDGGGDALQTEWRGNAFDDYQGYDFDGDGVGDVPYQVTDFSGGLHARHPDLAFFGGSAALALVNALGRAFPLVEPRVILRDASPRMAGASPGVAGVALAGGARAR